MKENLLAKIILEKKGGNVKILLIYNPSAGLRKLGELNTIKKFFDKNKYDYDYKETKKDHGPYEILKDANHDYDAIVSCGGDGTISQTVQGIESFNFTCPLLIVPLGTTNEISQNLGLHDDSLEKILERLNRYEIREVDYGLINNNKTFTYVLTFGNFTEVTYNTPQKMKNWLGYRAYVLYGFLTFRRINTFRVLLKSDIAKVGGNYVFGSISNSLSVGTIFHYNREDTSLSDGLFEVLLISKPNSVKELRLILTGLIQKKYDNQMFTVFRTNSLDIQTFVDVDWNIDGEFGGTYQVLNVTNQQKKLKLFV